jgi:hypothetical protein
LSSRTLTVGKKKDVGVVAFKVKRDPPSRLVNSTQSAVSVEKKRLPFTMFVPDGNTNGAFEKFDKSVPSVKVVARAAPPEAIVRHVVASSPRANFFNDFRIRSFFVSKAISKL